MRGALQQIFNGQFQTSQRSLNTVHLKGTKGKSHTPLSCSMMVGPKLFVAVAAILMQIDLSMLCVVSTS